jgi:hypothetical protein
MKPGDTINSFISEFLDVWHYKIVDEPILKEDSFTSVDFSENINAPFEVYEKYIRAIEIERRVAYIGVETPTEEFPSSELYLDDMVLESLREGETFKTFYGEYDEEMKKKIEDYIEEQGYKLLRRDESISERIPGYRYCPYSCNIYGWEHTLGFYLERIGMLRGCIKPTFDEGDSEYSKIYGLPADFQDLENHLDKKYIQYLYGEEGWQKLHTYYKQNFIDSFKYGKSLLWMTSGRGK